MSEQGIDEEEKGEGKPQCHWHVAERDTGSAESVCYVCGDEADDDDEHKADKECPEGDG